MLPNLLRVRVCAFMVPCCDTRCNELHAKSEAQANLSAANASHLHVIIYVDVSLDD